MVTSMCMSTIPYSGFISWEKLHELDFGGEYTLANLQFSLPTDAACMANKRPVYK